MLAAPALAGCISTTVDPATTSEALLGLVSQAVYGDMLAEHTPIASFDGTVLDAWVYRPDTSATGEKVPIIINFSPYWSNAAPATDTGGDAFSLYLLDYFVPRGYAVALVSARGTGLSEGCFTIGGPLELQDEDFVATHLAELPWSNGNVTASGKSYDGTMAQGLLAMGNPHVKTIVPVSPISELYKYNYVNGVPYLVTGQAFNTYYTATTSLAQQTDPRDPTFDAATTRVCDESAEVQTNQYVSLTTGDYTPYWQARNYTALLPDNIEASVFYIHGLGDWNVKTDHMVPWIEELHARNVTVKMWLGQWGHDYPTRADWNMTMLRWLDHYLKGVDTGILNEPLVQVQAKDGTWRNEDSWPVRTATPSVHYMSSNGELGDAPGSGTGMYLDTPGQGTLTYVMTIDEDVRLAGTPSINVRLSSTGPRATLSASLALDGKVFDQAFLDLAHRETLETTTPMVPGTNYDVSVGFYPQDILLPAGSKLTLTIAHNVQGPVTTTPMPTNSVVTVMFGDTTFLTLPLVAYDATADESPQPEDVGCWAC